MLGHGHQVEEDIVLRADAQLVSQRIQVVNHAVKMGEEVCVCVCVCVCDVSVCNPTRSNCNRTRRLLKIADGDGS